jgi:hypothetical protein
MDVGKFLRLKEGILGSLKSVSGKSSATSGDALPNAYKKFREQAKEILDPSHVYEFDRLFPVWSRDGAPVEVLQWLYLGPQERQGLDTEAFERIAKGSGSSHSPWKTSEICAPPRLTQGGY